MNTTFIKLYRKLKYHEIIRDSTAFHIFIWILICVDYKTGSMISGRFWASSLLDIKPRTYHKALKRLEKKYDLVTLFSDNKKTTILVNNWGRYQGSSDTLGDNKVTTKGQQSDTNQEVKEVKEIKEVYTSNESKIFSYFKDLKVDNEKIVSLGKEFDVRPKDVVWCIRDMIGKSDEKGLEIKNVRAKLKTWINNSIRWHKVATLTQKEQTKPKPRLTEDDKLALEILKIREERKNAKTT